MPVYRDAKRGTYYVSYSASDPITGKNVHITKRGFKTNREATKWEKDSKSSGSPVSNITFSEILNRWEDYTSASPVMREKHEYHLRIRFTNYLDKPIANIKKSDLAEWRYNLDRGPWSTKTKNDTISYVKAAFRFANEVYDLPNPAKMLRPFKKTDEEMLKEMEIWTPEEFEQFLNSVDDPEYKLFFKFLFWTGCRRGEAIALQKQDVYNKQPNNHFVSFNSNSGDKKRDVFVYVRYSQRDQKSGLRPTKTKQKRYIQLDNELSKSIEPLLSTKGKYVFGGEKGLSPSNILKAFNKAIEKSGVKHIRIHDLRHSHASWLINNGVNIVAVSKRLGHSTVQQTLKTYTHLLERTDEEMMAMINSFVSRSSHENEKSQSVTDNLSNSERVRRIEL